MPSPQAPLAPAQYAWHIEYGLQKYSCFKSTAMGIQAAQGLSLGLQLNGY
jgi:hypothetical protein